MRDDNITLQKAQVKACNTPENHQILNIFLVSSKRNYQKRLWKYNEFNKGVIQNEYYIYEI